jgi:hypothetical protein
VADSNDVSLQSFGNRFISQSFGVIEDVLEDSEDLIVGVLV